MIFTDSPCIALSETIFKKGDETPHFQKLARGHEEMQAETVFLQSYRQCTRKLSLDLNSAAHDLYFHFSSACWFEGASIASLGGANSE